MDSKVSKKRKKKPLTQRMTEIARQHGFVGEISGDTFADADAFGSLLDLPVDDEPEAGREQEEKD